MAKEATLNSIEAKIDQLTRKVDRLIKVNEAKEVWVTAKWIMELTGWNAHKMAAVRQQNIIQHRINDNNGIEYLLGSLPTIFIKNKG